MTTQMTTTRSNLKLHRLQITALTVGMAALVWAVLRMTGVDLEVSWGPSTRKVDIVSVVFSALVMALLAWAFLTTLERLATSRRHSSGRPINPSWIYTVAASTSLVLSLPSPIVQAVGWSDALGLVLLHLTVGAVLIPGLRRTASKGQPRRAAR
ncbi:DUF6069 family protein [Kribbella deserti]|uniref:DUF6069 family protein n=1 Tax=Kribbella deserti TaxID=1926257 RepID=A0ABV6QGV4_9ACTN